MFSYAQHAPWTPQVEASIVAAVHELARDVAAEATEIRYLDPDDSSGKSAAVVVNDRPLVHTALLVPLDKTGRLVGARDAQAQTRYLIDQLRKVLRSAGSRLKGLVKLNVVAATPADVKIVERTLASIFNAAEKPALTLVAGDMPYEGVLVAIDGVAVSDENVSDVTVRNNSAVFHEPRQSQAAILPPGEKIFLSGWIDRGKGELQEVVDATLAFQIELLQQLGSQRDRVVQLRAFLNMSQQRQVVQRAVDKLFKDQAAVPPIVYVPWGREGAPEIELIAAGRFAPTDTNQKRQTVEYFNVPGVRASGVFSRATRVNSDRLIYVSGIVASQDADSETQIREILNRLQNTLKAAGSDLQHMAKATYFLADRAAAQALTKVRRELYNPKRPPAASAFTAQSVGYENRAANIDMIAVPRAPSANSADK